jgi:hypothetical protein
LWLKGGHVTTKLDSFFAAQGLRPMGTLAHFGIKGQKWGVRRSDSQLSSSKGSSEAADAARARTTQAAIKKAGGTSSVSDADLNQLVNRLNLEKRYTDIKSSTSLSTKTQSKVKKVLSIGDTMNAAIRFSASPAGKLLASKVGLSKISDVATLAVKAAPKEDK